MTDSKVAHGLTLKEGSARWRSRAALFLLTALVKSGSALGFLHYDPDHPIYDDIQRPHAVDELPVLLEDLNASKLPVIFYLHGRGAEPDKSFNPSRAGGGAVPRLRSEYNARVVLINWNSRGTGKDRSEPLSHITEGGDTLHAVLVQLAQFEHNNPGMPRPSLLVHSMGSIVLADTVKRFGWPTGPDQPLFTSILLSEPDVDSQGHAEWLSMVATTELVYVTQNRRDSILMESTDSRTPASNFALGLDPVPPYAAAARYVDLTDALKVFPLNIGAHQIFSKSVMGGNVDTCQFMTKVLRGEKFEPLQIAGLVLRSGGRYKASPRPDKSDGCFDNTVVGDDEE
jgi:hypothetical protein